MSPLIEEYDRVGLADKLELNEQWLLYQRSARNEPLPVNGDGTLDIVAYWQGMMNRAPGIAAIVKVYIYFPVSSVDAERSFSQYKHLINDRRTSLTEENTKQLTMLYFNKELSGRWDGYTV